MFAVEETTPKFGSSKKPSGAANTFVLVTLKASAPNSNRWDSVMEEERKNERSRFLFQWAFKVLWPTFPKVKGAWFEKAATFNGFVVVPFA